MALAVWQAHITDRAGNIIPGASIRVTDAETGDLVTLKPARDGSGSQANPFTADADGFALFYVAKGRYDIRVTSAGLQRDYVDVVLFDDPVAEEDPGDYLLATPVSGTTHDYTPAGWSATVKVLDLEPGAGAAVIGGLPPSTNGHTLVLTCVHANGLTLLAQDGTATAAWRLRLAFDLALTNGMSVTLQYSTAINRWIVCT
jgi:hypothetical protein